MSPRETSRQTSFWATYFWPIGGVIGQYQYKIREEDRYEAPGRQPGATWLWTANAHPACHSWCGRPVMGRPPPVRTGM